MKTHKKLYSQIYNFQNLLVAATNAQKGKKCFPEISRFNIHLEENLFTLQEELSNKTYQPGQYRAFKVMIPKERMISAAPYRDRVVHHALCNITAPLFEKTFIYDSYANRKGKGTHKALDRFQYYARQYEYVLKCDIRKFFPSIDHELLKQELRWKIACEDTLWLMDKIIDNSNPQEPHLVYFPNDDLFTPHQRNRGLPIGNLTSQWWGNIYMNRFDHFVKETLQVKGYIRYVDDFVLFGNSKKYLHEIQQNITQHLQHLRLIIHPNKSQIIPTKKGVPFLGFQVFPHYKIVKKESTRRYFRFLKKKLEQQKVGKTTWQAMEDGVNSWLGHIKQGHSERLEYNIYWYFRRKGVNLVRHPRGSWRFLEQ